MAGSAACVATSCPGFTGRSNAEKPNTTKVVSRLRMNVYAFFKVLLIFFFVLVPFLFGSLLFISLIVIVI